MQSLDSYLGIHTAALALEARRTDVLAANLANVDTPNYKARDIDFKAALAAAAGTAGAGGAGGTSSTLPLQPSNATSVGESIGGAAGTGSAAGTGVGGSNALDPAELKYRVPMAPALDGNTVDEQLEQAAFAENSVHYQATLTFLNTKLRDLMTAITGS
jgi:flagellar basal-body rod protein FlgB